MSATNPRFAIRLWINWLQRQYGGNYIPHTVWVDPLQYLLFVAWVRENHLASIYSSGDLAFYGIRVKSR